MKRKKKKSSSWIILILIGLLIAGFYLFLSPKGTGVFISCGNHEILGIRSLPTYAMEMVATKYCDVNLSVYSLNNSLICSKDSSIFNSEMGVVECNNLKNHKGEEVIVKATFFDLNNNSFGPYTKNLVSNP